MRLNELPRDGAAIIDSVEDRGESDAVAQRLRELGFVPGEPVRVVAMGPVGGDPLAVQIGFTRFALRRAEAARVVLRSADLIEAPPTAGARAA